jgi:hypothetical protein
VRLATHPQAGATMRELLIDTDVLIWHLRGYPKAAAALENGLAVLTGNTKHFRTIPDLQVVPFKP